MTRKDITLVGISALFIIVSLYFMLNMLDLGSNTKKNSQNNNQENQQKTDEITGNFDKDETLDQIKKLRDYGGAELNNIGRVNPFGPLN